jgi:predicted acyltransferase
VLYTAGLASMTLGVFYWFADVLKKDKQVKMLAAFGINPLALYVGSELIIMILGLFPVFGSENQVLPTWLFNTLVSAGMAPNMASLVWALLYTALFAVMAWVLYKKKIIIKL